MKRSFLPALLILLSLACSTQCQAQSRTDNPLRAEEKISKQFRLSGDAARSTLAVYNIIGAVTVQGYSGNEVVVEATKTIRAESAQTLETGKREAVLGFLQRNDSVVVYLAGPHDSRPNRGRNNRNERREDPGYNFQFDFVIKVPAAMNLHVATVTDGKVLVQDVTGSKLEAYNVNGSISLLNVRGTTTARTVNGSVDATYTSSPTGPCSYNTINGQLNVTYPRDVAADVHFKSMHGELYTDFPEAELRPVQVSQTQQAAAGGTKYKLSKDRVVRLGKGGKDFRFETLNGDVTIKQQPR
ncbi:hypothetical protein LJ737_09255 [Hymenobacter sp. 15J16-1T3B]|uniref:hypothetical protein n=1 Tax=Hymenobacter sp. 15J16-1T3B TaxID=2886941 RepID=UPI001D0FFA9C|nr:hypothetical protein [Hymenobacter sp. 15J16-1T3B]MCC3157426.1 hypothetical protein [Hymenobacter sp. 15J16-1T3B]